MSILIKLFIYDEGLVDRAVLGTADHSFGKTKCQMNPDQIK